MFYHLMIESVRKGFLTGRLSYEDMENCARSISEQYNVRYLTVIQDIRVFREDDTSVKR